MNKMNINNIRKTILGFPINGAWFCNNCKKENPSGNNKCRVCGKKCEYIYVGYTNWIKIGIPFVIVMWILIFESLYLYVYLYYPDRIHITYLIPTVTLTILSPILLIIGSIAFLLYIENGNLLQRVYEKKGLKKNSKKIPKKNKGFYCSNCGKELPRPGLQCPFCGQ